MTAPLEGIILVPNPTGLPAAFIESITPFDYTELPRELRETLELWCEAFQAWAQTQDPNDERIR